jgi:hypothetical protein
MQIMAVVAHVAQEHYITSSVLAGLGS